MNGATDKNRYLLWISCPILLASVFIAFLFVSFFLVFVFDCICALNRTAHRVQYRKHIITEPRYLFLFCERLHSVKSETCCSRRYSLAE